MKTAKSFAQIIFALAVLSSCQKYEYSTPTAQQKEVIFSSLEMNVENTKNSEVNAYSCDYAIVQIDQNVYKIDVYELDDKQYSTTLKLTTGQYRLNSFMLMSNNLTPADSTDDRIVYASPLEGSPYASYVSEAAGFEFEVGTLNKVEVPVNVVLFNPEDYQKFGFDYSMLTQTTSRSQRFTGQFKVKDPAVYAGSLYESQSTGLQQYMPAIYRIDVYRNDQFIKTYNNENTQGESPLEIGYPDGDQTTDEFKFELYLYVKTGNAFDYRYIHAWYFSDDQTLPTESDGLVHFSVGDTDQSQQNYSFGPYLDVPQYCSLTIDFGIAPGSLGSYFNGIVSGIDGNYALQNGRFPSYCGTDTVGINLGYAYQMRAISSLTSDLLPQYARGADRWNALNWLYNHLENYAFYDWDILQGASWMILNDWDGTGHSGVSQANSIVLQMVSDARQHPDFIPAYGQKAAIVFVPKNVHADELQPSVQVVFTMTTL